MLDEYAWVTSPFGLGLSSAVWWNSTPRELAAHRKAVEQSRGFFTSIMASIQSALHNGPMTRKDGRIWEPEMFMPGYVSPDPDVPGWKMDRDRMLAQRRRATQGDPKPDNQAAVVMIDHRMKRAQEAKERGESKDVIDRIMQGRL